MGYLKIVREPSYEQLIIDKEGGYLKNKSEPDRPIVVSSHKVHLQALIEEK